MSNYSKTHVSDDARTELHDKLSLTGAEISINNLPAGAGVPFVHSHKRGDLRGSFRQRKSDDRR